jgi:type IV secretion system protein VirB6
MASATAVFSTAYTFIDSRLDAFLHIHLSNVISLVTGPLRVALVLYIVLYGIAVVRGAIAEPMIDFVVRSIKLCIVLALATTAAYTTNITDPLFQELPNALARAISGSDVSNVGGSFDQFFAYGAVLADKIAKYSTTFDVLAYIISCVVFIVTAIAAALGFGVIVVAKLALALLVALGPIFIACSIFEGSRRFFFGWLAQAVNYIVLFALMITVFELVLALMKSEWPNIDGETNLKVAGMVFSALCLLGAIFFLQVPGIAAGIAGGASTGVADFFAAGNFALNRPRRALSTAAPRSSGASNGGRPSGGSIKPSGARA